MEQYDVIIVGAGGSGLAAAVRAAQLKCSVLVLEKQSQAGGTTGIAVGSFTANRTRHQEQAAINDTLENHATDAGRFAPGTIEAKNNPERRRQFLDESAATLHWLESMGLHFSGPHPEPPNRVPRMHNVIPGAKAYIRILSAQLQRLGGEMKLSAPASELIQQNSRVTGVHYQEKGESRKAFARLGVVLAAGDYANGSDLIAQHKGPEFANVEGINPKATGEGHKLAHSISAQLLNMDVTYGPELRFVAPRANVQWTQLAARLPIPSPLSALIANHAPEWLIRIWAKRMLVTWQHPEDQLFADGAILINQSGGRFCDEQATPDRELAVASQQPKHAYILLDQTLIERYSQWPHFISTAPEIAYAYVRDYLRLRPDVAVSGTTLEEVAKKRGLPPAEIAKTVEAYNRNARAGRNAPDSSPRPLQGKQWVLLGPAKAYFTTTEGGVAIDDQCRALRGNGSVIEGLYAVGQNGLGGQILWGHGLHIAWAMTSGRLVGEHLAGQK